PGLTPWRTITLGESLQPIVETTVPFDVVEPLYEASKPYEFSRGSWSWIIKMDHNTIFPVQKDYIDFSAAMGWETVLVDALWDTQIGREKVEELAAYGKSKGVDLFLWYNSNGYWNDAPQGPHGFMDKPFVRRKEMAWMKSIGIRGIKVDFFGGDKQVTLKVYEDILYDANDFGLLVVFHGCTLPRGWERMFPNYASSEAVLASEMLHFSQERCNTEAFHACMHPFVRNTVGSMDFGGTVLNEFWNGTNTPNRGTKRLTSDVFQLATAVLFQSPVQHFAMAPNNLTDAPDWAIAFMKNIPTTWDDIRFIDGYPGKYVILARRHGDMWFIAGINAQKETLRVKTRLPMIPGGAEFVKYSDDEQLTGSVSKGKMTKNQEFEWIIPGNGGMLLVR
nr:glycoside hydrolase family 97 catalytic domain-containing protein [Prolixibacteraceae bacterium]